MHIVPLSKQLQLKCKYEHYIIRNILSNNLNITNALAANVGPWWPYALALGIQIHTKSKKKYNQKPCQCKIDNGSNIYSECRIVNDQSQTTQCQNVLQQVLTTFCTEHRPYSCLSFSIFLGHTDIQPLLLYGLCQHKPVYTLDTQYLCPYLLQL